MDNIVIIPEPLSLLAQIIATIILFLVMSKFLFGPVKQLLKNRQDYVMSNMKESEDAKAESYRMKKEYETKLQSAKEEASEIVANARSFGEDIKAKAIKESKEEADKIYQNGVKALELERQKVMTSLNSDIVDMAMMGAEKVLREKSTSDLDRNFVEKFVADMEATNE